MGTVLLVIYFLAGYWAVCQTALGKSPLLGDWSKIHAQRFVCALLLGWIVIPYVIIKKVLKSKKN